MEYRKDILEASTDPISWTIGILNRYDLRRIVLIFAVAPVTHEHVNVTIKSESGDCLLRTIEVVGVSDLSIENLGPVEYGDTVLVEYANTDGRSIKGFASVEI